MIRSTAQVVMSVSDDLPIPVARPVHSGKVRSLYCLKPEDSQRLIRERAYPVPAHSDLALMVISDRLSAFDCLWHAESLSGVPGKGAALNAIASHWFQRFRDAGLAPHHLLDMPHPMLWVVRRGRPLMIEAIARRYLTGSLWRAYERGERVVGGVALPEGLTRFQRLPELLFTPSTKGVVRGVPGLAEADDHPVASAVLHRHWAAFGFREADDVTRCEEALRRGFKLIEGALEARGDLLVDSKFEFAIAPGLAGDELMYMDEVGTPDSSRVWRRADWERGQPREQSKEQFRGALLDWIGDPALLLDGRRMAERVRFAKTRAVPDDFFTALGATYRQQAREITGREIEVPDDPRASVLDTLREFGFAA